MKNNKILDAFEAMGPDDAEKQQILDKLLETKVKKPINLRPLGIAAGLLLFAAVSIPLLTPWFKPDTGGIGTGATEDPAAAMTDPAAQATDPAVAAVTAEPTSKPRKNGAVLLREEILELPENGVFALEASYQEVVVSFTDGPRATIRHYDFPDRSPFDIATAGKTVTVKPDPSDILKNTNRDLAGALFEIALPRGYNGDVSLTTGMGDITLADIPAIQAIVINGELSLTTGMGDVRFNNDVKVKTDLFITSGMGDIRAKYLRAEEDIRISTGMGDITFGTAQGKDVTLVCGFGVIRADAIISETYLVDAGGFGESVIGTISGEGSIEKNTFEIPRVAMWDYDSSWTNWNEIGAVVNDAVRDALDALDFSAVDSALQEAMDAIDVAKLEATVSQALKEAMDAVNITEIDALAHQKAMETLDSLVYSKAVPYVHRMDGASELTLNLGSENINIRRGGDMLTIRYDLWMDDHYILTHTDGKVTLGQNPMINSWGWLDNILRNKGVTQRSVDVTVPASMPLDSLIINTGSGKISLDGLEMNKVDMNYGSGDVSFTGCKFSGSAICNFGSGTVNVQNSTFASGAAFNYGSGTVNLKDSAFTGSVSLSYGSGKLDVSGCAFDSLNASGGSGGGTITLVDSADNYDISFSSSSKTSGTLTYNGQKVEHNDLRNKEAASKISLSGGSGSFAVNDPKNN